MIHPTAVLGDDVLIGDDVTIEPFVVIGDGAHIGDGCHIAAHAVVGRACVIGPRSHVGIHVVLYDDVHVAAGTVLRSGACIGTDGFGFAWDGSGFRKIPQVGGCRIGEQFTAGENATVDRGSIGPTRIDRSVVLGPLSHIGHNANVGSDVIVAGLCGIAGSAVIEDGVQLAQQSATVGHITVGGNVRLDPWSGITQSAAEGQHLAGVPARPADDVEEAGRLLHAMPALVRRITELLRVSDAAEKGKGRGPDHSS